MISEPMTMATDYVIAIACVFFLTSILARRRRLGRGRVGIWVAGFAATSLAALAGGTAHGFRVPLGPWWSFVWSLTVCSIATSSAFLIAAGVTSARAPEAEDERARQAGYRWLERGVWGTLAAIGLLLAGVSFHDHFNANDLYHVVQLAGLYCLYRAVLHLHQLGPG